jgi:mutator protein MutT
MARVAAIILNLGSVLLIRRKRSDTTYYLFPGGQIELGETHEQALRRELDEELGLAIVIGRHVAEIEYKGNSQCFYLTELRATVPPQFVGDEAEDAVWVPIADLRDRAIYPEAVAKLIEAPLKEWPVEVLRAVDVGRQ